MGIWAEQVQKTKRSYDSWLLTKELTSSPGVGVGVSAWLVQKINGVMNCIASKANNEIMPLMMPFQMHISSFRPGRRICLPTGITTQRDYGDEWENGIGKPIMQFF